MSKHLPNNKKLKTNAQNLRKQLTKWERHLWYDFLREYPIQFNRQKNIGEYIVDFYCKQAMLVVELDGQYHLDDEFFVRDRERTKYFEELGITVLRFKNVQIDNEFSKVCDKIDAMVDELINKCSESEV